MQFAQLPLIYAAVPGSLIFFVVLGIVTFLIIITFTIYYLYKIISSQERRRFTGAEAIINSVGTASQRIDVNGSGFIAIDGVSWEVINTGSVTLEKYDTAIVTGRKGVVLLVKKYEQKK